MAKNYSESVLEEAKKRMGGLPYAFFRAEGFYPLVLSSDEEARANAACNPGTLRVENIITEEVVWKLNEN